MNPGKTLVKDPVCNMDVDPARARGSPDYKGKPYFSCRPGCVDPFRHAPKKYLAPKPPSQLVQLGGRAHANGALPARAPVANRGAVSYVCPMDPEVRESKPGACPRCGMALEPETVEYTCPMHPEIDRDRPCS